MVGLQCAFCGESANHRSLGPLLGPLGDTEYYVHRPCALWSPEVHESENGTLLRVLEAVRRGRQLRCSFCNRRGASLGCRVHRCKETFHALCAQQAGCVFYLNHCISCRQHARRFITHPVHPAPIFTAISSPLPSPSITFNCHQRQHGALPENAAAAIAAVIPHSNVDTECAMTDNGQSGQKRPVGETGFISPVPGSKRSRIETAYIRRARVEGIRKRAQAQYQKTIDQGSDDEEHFRKKERARTQRDIAKLNPITLGTYTTITQARIDRGEGGADPGWTTAAALKQANKADNDALARTAPDQHQHGSVHDTSMAPMVSQKIYQKPLKGTTSKLDAPTVQVVTQHTSVIDAIVSTSFDDLAGLHHVIMQLRESVLLPLMYPEMFKRMHVMPARGILFHGEPGTGKTLAARALAGACARCSPVPITFFSRKGADCLGKFVGEAERTLRLMFDQAALCAPSIIFLDELDALVPSRNGDHGGGGGSQDQIHASVVATLLSLMDGLIDRGNVIVIAATNRSDSIDPALRRPGRFDKEIYFGLPSMQHRTAILDAHTRKWNPRPTNQLLERVAVATEGFAGADLAGLCTAAVLAAVRRSVPGLDMLYEGSKCRDPVGYRSGNHGKRSSNKAVCAGQQQQPSKTSLLDSIQVTSDDWDAAIAAAPPPCSRRGALSALLSDAVRPIPWHLSPMLVLPMQRILQEVVQWPLAAQMLNHEALTGINRLFRHTIDDLGGDADAALQVQVVDKVLQELGIVEKQPGHLCIAPGAGEDTDRLASDTLSSSASHATATIADSNKAASVAHKAAQPHCLLLLSGDGASSEELLAGAVLKLFQGSSSICVISIPAMAESHGAGDAASTSSSILRLLEDGLRKSKRGDATVVYMPRIESWAVCTEVLDLDAGVSNDNNSSGMRTITASAPAAPATTSVGGRSPRSSFEGIASPFSPAAVWIPGSSSMHPVAPPSDTASPLCSTATTLVASEAWNAFDCIVQDASAHQQPCLVVATTHCGADRLPSKIAQKFTSIVSVNDDNVHGHPIGIERTRDGRRMHDQTKKKGRQGTIKNTHVANNGVRFAAERTALVARSVLAAKVALAVLDKGRQHTIQESNNSGVLSGGEMPMETTTRKSHSRDTSAVTTVSPSQFQNTAEEERAVSAHLIIQKSIVHLGQILLKDRRCKMAGTWIKSGPSLSPVTCIDGIPPAIDVTVDASIDNKRSRCASFMHIAHAAAGGYFVSLDQLKHAVVSVVADIVQSEQEEYEAVGRKMQYKNKRLHGSSYEHTLLWHPRAVSFAHALQDFIDASCHEIWLKAGILDSTDASLHNALKMLAEKEVVKRKEYWEECALKIKGDDSEKRGGGSGGGGDDDDDDDEQATSDGNKRVKYSNNSEDNTQHQKGKKIEHACHVRNMNETVVEAAAAAAAEAAVKDKSSMEILAEEVYEAIVKQLDMMPILMKWVMDESSLSKGGVECIQGALSRIVRIGMDACQKVVDGDISWTVADILNELLLLLLA